VFQAKCAGCHTLGGGKTVGPDLAGVLKRRDKAWVTRFVAEPDKVIAEGDATAKQLVAEHGGMPMPNVGLSAEEVAAVVDYMGGGAAAPAPAASAAPVAAGDPALGRQLFTGERRFQAGGAACISCHHAGTPGLGGGTLAKDLTGVAERLGPGLAPALETLPFPLMKDVYAGKLPTKEEAAALAAYFQEVGKAPQTAGNGGASFMAIGAGGALVLFAGMGLFWPRRRRSVHARLKGPGRN
jgi:mono/diheme cytochrome c family protein